MPTGGKECSSPGWVGLVTKMLVWVFNIFSINVTWLAAHACNLSYLVEICGSFQANLGKKVSKTQQASWVWETKWVCRRYPRTTLTRWSQAQV
jgi:hypothetical protein